jgi:hypothetical protein
MRIGIAKAKSTKENFFLRIKGSIKEVNNVPIPSKPKTKDTVEILIA